MIIKSIRVKNFRSILDETLNCENLTALVGANGCGKSTFLRAMELFYASSPHISREDYYNRQSGVDIEIAITFSELSPPELERFESRVTEGILMVMRVFSTDGRSSYFGYTKQYPRFADARSKTGREFLNAYRELKDEGVEIATVRSEADGRAELERWEHDNPGDGLEYLRDDGKFFGFANVARGYLGDSTRFIFVPAVRDAADDVREGRNTAITQLMDLVVRTTIAGKKEIVDLRAEIQERYAAMTSVDSLPALAALEGTLTSTLQAFYKLTSFALDWRDPEQIVLPPPQTDVSLQQEGFKIPVERTGHGLQRAVILTLLQHLAVTTTEKKPDNAEAEAAKPELNLIIGIEEPELYQHPSQQRHFARTLYGLAFGHIPGVAAKTQIIYATHSPLLVGIDRFNNVRCVRHMPVGEGKPRETKVVGTTWGEIARTLWQLNGARGAEYTEDTIKPRVSSLMTPWMNEGFFANVVVLVEGEGDRAAILGAALNRGVYLESEGVAVIPVDGKDNLDRPALIFSELKIPTFLIWDSDRTTDKEAVEKNIPLNRKLLRLVHAEETDWPAGAFERYACFENKLEVTIRDQIGNDLFEKLLGEEASSLGFTEPSRAKKNADVISNILRRANDAGSQCALLEDIVTKIIEMRSRA